MNAASCRGRAQEAEQDGTEAKQKAQQKLRRASCHGIRPFYKLIEGCRSCFPSSALSNCAHARCQETPVSDRAFQPKGRREEEPGQVVEELDAREERRLGAVRGDVAPKPSTWGQEQACVHGHQFENLAFRGFGLVLQATARGWSCVYGCTVGNETRKAHIPF